MSEFCCQNKKSGIRIIHMWPFSYKAKRSDEDPGEVRERVKALESDLKLIRAEWNDIYDRIVHQFERERKRRTKMASDSLADPNGAGEPSRATPQPDWSDPIEIMKQARLRGL